MDLHHLINILVYHPAFFNRRYSLFSRHFLCNLDNRYQLGGTRPIVTKKKPVASLAASLSVLQCSAVSGRESRTQAADRAQNALPEPLFSLKTGFFAPGLQRLFRAGKCGILTVGHRVSPGARDVRRPAGGLPASFDTVGFPCAAGGISGKYHFLRTELLSFYTIFQCYTCLYCFWFFLMLLS